MRSLHKEELNRLYSSSNKVRGIKSTSSSCAGHVARISEGKSHFKTLTGKPTGRRSSGRPRRGWEDNNRIYIKEIGINTRNWVNSAQDRDYWRAFVNVALNLWIP